MQLLKDSQSKAKMIILLLDNNWLKHFAKGSIKDIDIKERIDAEIADNEPGA